MTEPTIEQKAAAFDALCAAFKGRGRVVSSFRCEKMSTAPAHARLTAGATIAYEDIVVWEWRLHANGCDDFAAAAIRMIRP